MDPGAGLGVDPAANPGVGPGVDPRAGQRVCPQAGLGVDPGVGQGVDQGVGQGVVPRAVLGVGPRQTQGQVQGLIQGWVKGVDLGAGAGMCPGTGSGVEQGVDPGAHPGVDPRDLGHSARSPGVKAGGSIHRASRLLGTDSRSGRGGESGSVSQVQGTQPVQQSCPTMSHWCSRGQTACSGHKRDFEVGSRWLSAVLSGDKGFTARCRRESPWPYCTHVEALAQANQTDLSL